MKIIIEPNESGIRFNIFTIAFEITRTSHTSFPAKELVLFILLIGALIKCSGLCEATRVAQPIALIKVQQLRFDIAETEIKESIFVAYKLRGNIADSRIHEDGIIRNR